MPPSRTDRSVWYTPLADICTMTSWSAIGRRAQLDVAVTEARNVAPGWRALDVADRVATVAAAATAAEQLKERDGSRLYTSEHGKVLAEAGFELDSAPMVATILGSMATAALRPSRIRRCRTRGCTGSPTALRPW